jgi:molecular chaperone DnaK (HSP70)
MRHKLGADIVATTPFSFIVTVLAIWTDAAKNTTRRCAKNAGLGDDVLMIAEPEAAAIHSLDMMDPHGLQIGESFCVCDAGSGTVDLITYEIVELKPVLKVREATGGTGSFCVSTYLNHIFKKHLENRFKRCAAWEGKTLDEAMEKFEITTKRNFGGDQTDEFVIPVGGLRDNAGKGVKRGKYSISGMDLGKVFAPVVTEVIKLVRQQVAASPSRRRAIMLVGGSGQSTHLREEIKKGSPRYSSLATC